MEAIIYINEHIYPAPNMGLGFTIKSNIETKLNANHTLIGQRLGKDIHELVNPVWQMLDASTWANMIKEFNETTCAEIRFPNMMTNTWQTRYMYAQEQSAEVQDVNAQGMPIRYRNCTMTLIDSGR